MFSVGLAWLVYRLTGSSLAVGITLTMQVTPALVFGIVAGPAADVVDRRRLLVTCDVLRAIIVLVLGVAAWLGKIPLPAVYVATFLLFSASCFYEPTLGATIPRLVEMSALTRANALASMGREVSDMTGRALGGFVVQLYGASVAFFGDALSFLLAALATIGALCGQIAPRSTSHRRITLAWGQALGELSRNVLAFRAIAYVVIINVTVGPLSVALPVIADRNGIGALGFGTMSASVAAGALAGASLAPLMKRRLGGLSLPLATGLYSLLLPLAGVANTPLVTFPALVVAGGLMTLSMVCATTLLQETVPVEMLGRALSARGMMLRAIAPIMLLSSGALLSRLTPGLVLAIYAALGGLMLVAVEALARLRARTAARVAK